ncbi:Uncharacterised protein [BD1-7 clade bacterium]|uniref:Uncharacterized protein n=1 Tax=BD1-7 clade bacterium TaxID=2029982 RepID=A0A5S9NQJ1_9GAMM|nr:Uncharacterised protein [BD1-7 clade bacterium]
MKYITENEDGFTSYTPYFEYIESIRNKLPSHVYEFASNTCHYDLRSPETLHDAWLDHITVAEPASGERSQLRSIQIETRLLGPFHDRSIFITYTDVVAFEMNTPEEFSAPPFNDVGHGDLLCHEVRLEANGTLVHEMEFSRGSIIIIKCKNIEHRQELLGHA